MKLYTECIPCFLQQALRAARAAGADDGTQQAILRRVMQELSAADWSVAPIEIARGVYRVVRDITGVDDPFGELKAECNRRILELYPSLQEQLATGDSPLRRAVQLAIAGNIMDFAALADFDVAATIRKVECKGFTIDDYDAFERELTRAQSLLLFADNAGEIVFDKLLIETILAERPLRVSVVVKSGPLVNDATLEDAEQIGLDAMPGVEILAVSNGDDGSSPDYASPELAEWIDGHDVVISKGQANYEALSEQDGIVYMLMVKCPLIARDIGATVGDIVLQYR
jgi:uncharacterized protein with ATP-grasp and redox domains